MIAAIYARKSQDDSDKGEAQSTVRQIERGREFAASRGWSVDERFVWEDVGISGAEFEKRPGLQALLRSLKSGAFGVLIVSESSRLGRDTIRTLTTIQQIIDAGVKLFSYLDGREISLDDEMDEVQAFIGSWAASAERRKAAARVRDALWKRAENGQVAGGKAFGYVNYRPGPKEPVVRRIDEAQAAIVRRVFEMAAQGFGFIRIAKKLNDELLDGPRGPVVKGPPRRGGWQAAGVREVLRRDLYRGIAIFGKVKKTRKGGTKKYTKTDPSQWHRREMPELRIVSDELWEAAQAKIAESSAQFLRLSGKLAGQRENHFGKFGYLLSGFVACGVCNGPLVATKRGRVGKSAPAYVCRYHRFSGSCSNVSAVPIARIEAAVIAALHDTMSAENFERLQRTRAADEQARSAREAERAALLARIPVLNDEAERLANAVAAGSGTLEVLLSAIKARQAEREKAEARVVEIESEERDLREQAEAVETFRQRWDEWRGALNAEPILARQLLRKILVGPILVLPKGQGAWEFIGGSRFDAILHGVLTPRADAVRAWSPAARARQVDALRTEFPTTSQIGSSAWAGVLHDGGEPLG